MLADKVFCEVAVMHKTTPKTGLIREHVKQDSCKIFVKLHVQSLLEADFSNMTNGAMEMTVLVGSL